MTRDDLIPIIINAIDIGMEYEVRKNIPEQGAFQIGYAMDGEFTVVDTASSLDEAKDIAFILTVRSAADAFLGQLYAAGLAIVPREASKSAAEKGAQAILNSETLRQLEIVRSCYRAMVEYVRVK